MKTTEEELKEYCYKWLSKAFETGLRQSPTDAENSEFYRPMIDLSWSKQMESDLSALIEQEKREAATGLLKYFKYMKGIISPVSNDEWFDKYLKQQ